MAHPTQLLARSGVTGGEEDTESEEDTECHLETNYAL